MTAALARRVERLETKAQAHDLRRLPRIVFELVRPTIDGDAIIGAEVTGCFEFTPGGGVRRWTPRAGN
jgi:hypothetical protein